MYFHPFPTIKYDPTGSGYTNEIKDIMTRVAVKKWVRNTAAAFAVYGVPDGATPDQVAFFLYDDTEYHWVVLMTNNITDRYYEWPMSQPQFQEFIEDKYGVADIDAIHHYEITTQSGRTSSNGPNDYSHLVECNSDESGAVSVSNRGYEQRLQDKYRSIRLLSPKYLSQFVEEFENLIKGE